MKENTNRKESVERKDSNKRLELVVHTMKNRRALLFIIAVFFFTYLFVAQSLTVVQLRYQMSKVKEELLTYENENKVLTQEIEKITTDHYVEEIARDRLKMVRSNEIPVTVVVDDKSQESAEETIETNEKLGIYVKDWYVEVGKWLKELRK